MTLEPRIEIDARGEVLRDAQGNARGGFRLPHIEAPLAAYRGRSTPRLDNPRAQNLCALTGAMQKFDAAQLKALYRTRAEFLRRFNLAVDAAALARRLTAEDAAAIELATARSAPVF
jgi:hypothetical protein